MKKEVSTYDFYDLVLSGDIGQLDIDNFIQKKTNNYQSEKINLLLKDIEYCLFCEKEEVLGTFSKEEIEVAIAEWQRKKKELPFRHLPEIKSKEGKKVIPESKILDLEKLLFPYHFFPVYQLIAKLKNLIKKKSSNPDYTEKNESSASFTISDTKAAVVTAFEYMLEKDPRKHKVPLKESDFDKLVTWVSFYFDNDLQLPEISQPIDNIHTIKGNVVTTFKILYKELLPNSPYPDSLFQLIKICFKIFQHSKIENLRKMKEPAYYEELIRKT